MQNPDTMIVFSTSQKESQSNEKTFYFYFCVLHFPVMNIKIFNYTSRSLSVTAIVIFDFPCLCVVT